MDENHLIILFTRHQRIRESNQPDERIIAVRQQSYRIKKEVQILFIPCWEDMLWLTNNLIKPRVEKRRM